MQQLCCSVSNMSNNDKSPLIPDLGPINLSNLFQRRAESKEQLLSESYVKFEDYDNLSLLSIESLDNQRTHEYISVPQNCVKNNRKNDDRCLFCLLSTFRFQLFCLQDYRWNVVG